MKLYIQPRQSGKTTTICDLAQDLDMLDIYTWIMVSSDNEKYNMASRLKDKVDFDNIKIYDINKNKYLFNQRRPEKILCDEWYDFPIWKRMQLTYRHNDIISAWGTKIFTNHTGAR